LKPIFTLDYAEFCCAESLSDHFRPKAGYCVSIPISRQHKGFDLLLTRSSNSASRTITFQIKGSKYYPQGKKGKYSFESRFNNFVVGEVDFVILHTLYPEENNKANKVWGSLFLIFSAKEMQTLLSKARTKKAGNPETLFGIGFNTPDKIFTTRGFKISESITSHLLLQRIKNIEDALKRRD